MAYKRELIINNGSLTSYKKLLKVSDVCQLHSPKNFKSGTLTNVSFESTDGKTWVVNGTSDYTGVGRAFFEVSYDKIELIKNHHYLLRGAMKNWYDGTAVSTDNNSASTIDGLIFEQATTVYGYLYIAVTRNTYTNAIFKPQLFDLTEMYGAGNEPATVAEFKAKFPNDLYDYSPRCWVKSYKTGLIAKTKNLFNLATASVGYINSGGYLDNSEDTITYGLSSDYLECTPNTSYTISAFCGKQPVTLGGILWCRIAWYDENKQFLTGSTKSSTDTNIDYISATWTAPTNAKYLRASTLWMSPTYREQHPENWVMLEKGSTATDYVPYGYL